MLSVDGGETKWICSCFFIYILVFKGNFTIGFFSTSLIGPVTAGCGLHHSPLISLDLASVLDCLPSSLLIVIIFIIIYCIQK